VYFSEDFSKEVIVRSLTEEIYLSILYSIPFHIIAIWAIDHFYVTGRTNIFVDFEMALSFLTGRFGKEGESTSLLSDNLYQYFDTIIFYFGALVLTALVVGYVLRQAVWHLKLDVKFPSFFQYQNRWLYTFTGRDRKSKERLYGVVDALCLLGREKTRLYRGVVLGFDSNVSGDLEQIRLGLAYRGKFNETTKEFFWQEVPGSVFVLKYSTVQSLNVTYIPESSFNENSPSFLNLPALDQQTLAPVSQPSPAPAVPVPDSSLVGLPNDICTHKTPPAFPFKKILPR
jgi:hypothetical protein